MGLVKSFRRYGYVKTHLAIVQARWNNICPHLVPFDHVVAVFRMSTHRAGSVALVVTAVDLLCSEAEMSNTSKQRLSGSEHSRRVGEECCTDPRVTGRACKKLASWKVVGAINASALILI